MTPEQRDDVARLRARMVALQDEIDAYERISECGCQELADLRHTAEEQFHRCASVLSTLTGAPLGALSGMARMERQRRGPTRDYKLPFVSRRLYGLEAWLPKTSLARRYLADSNSVG